MPTTTSRALVDRVFAEAAIDDRGELDQSSGAVATKTAVQIMYLDACFPVRLNVLNHRPARTNGRSIRFNQWRTIVGACVLSLSACGSTGNVQSQAATGFTEAEVPSPDADTKPTEPTGKTPNPETQIEPTEPEASVGQTDADLPVYDPSSCDTAIGEPTLGTVTGVHEWVRLRRAPSLAAAEVERAGAGASLTFFPDSRTHDGERFWVTVRSPSAAGCASVAAAFIKGSDNRALDTGDPITYIYRALEGLEPEALHATFRNTGPEADPRPIAFDITTVQGGLADLAALGAQNSELDVRPDASFGDGSRSPGCRFSHGAVCMVHVFDGDRLVATAEVLFYGDGVNALSVSTIAAASN